MPDALPTVVSGITDSQLSQLCGTLRSREAECLRLVGQGLRSKHIAAALHLSPQTVDAYIKAAMRRLSVTDRIEAARLLKRYETGVPQSLGYQSRHLADRSGIDDFPSRHEGDDDQPLIVREERIPAPSFTTNRQIEPTPSASSWGTQLYDLARRHPAIAFALATFLFVMVLAGLLSAARNLQDILVSWVFPSR